MTQWHATFNETRHHEEDSSHVSSISQPSRQAGEFIRAEEFGTFLVEEAIIAQPVLERARRAAQSTQDRLDRVLLKLGLVAESDLAAALAKFFSLPLAEPADVPLEPVLPDIVDPEFIHRNGVIPLSVSKDKLIVGLIEPPARKRRMTIIAKVITTYRVRNARTRFHDGAH